MPARPQPLTAETRRHETALAELSAGDMAVLERLEEDRARLAAELPECDGMRRFTASSWGFPKLLSGPELDA